MNKINKQNELEKEKEFNLPLSVFVTAYSTKLNVKNNDYPDCLIKINGKPLIIYVLENLERNYIDVAYIITSTKTFVDRIEEEINKCGELNIKTNVIAINKNDEIDVNEMNLFLEIKSILDTNSFNKNNFLILNSDLIMDINIVELYNTHVLNNNFLTFVISQIEFQKNTNLKYYKESNQDLDERFKLIYGLDCKNSIAKNNGLISDNRNDGKIKNEEFYKVVCSNVANNVKLNLKYIESAEFQLEDSMQNIEFYLFNNKVFEILELNKIKEFTELNNQILPFLINHQNHRIVKNVNLGKPLQIYAYIKNDSCLKINEDYKILEILSEMIKPLDTINSSLVLTGNNPENIFTPYRNLIIENYVNKKKANASLPEKYKNIYMDCFISSQNISLPSGKFTIKKSSIGSNFDFEKGENSTITESVIFDHVSIGKK